MSDDPELAAIRARDAERGWAKVYGAPEDRRTLLRRLDAMTAERDALKAELAKQKECNAVLADRWAARTVEWGELLTEVKRLRDVLQYMLDDPALGPQSARRLARDALAATAPKVPPESVLPPLRDCCGTFAGSEHRITCKART